MADEQSNNDEDRGLSIFAKGIENIPAVLAAFEKYFGAAGSSKKVPIVAVDNIAAMRVQKFMSRPLWYKPVWDDKMRVTHEPSDMLGANDGLILNDKPYPLSIRTQNIPQGITQETVVISTVFLGLDHQHGDGDPILWETMIWIEGIDTYDLDQSQWRYTNQLDAMINHFAVVMRLQDLGYVMDMDESYSKDNPLRLRPPMVVVSPAKELGELERRGKRNRE